MSTEQRDAVSPTCEVVTRWHEGGAIAQRCGLPAVGFYPADGGGFMALCAAHAMPHASYLTSWPENPDV